MGDLDPVAFDIEPSGLDEAAVITVVGLAHGLGEFQIVNTEGRPVDQQALQQALQPHSAGQLEVTVVEDEAALLGALSDLAHERLDTDRHYLTGYNAETWNGGFDLPVVRSACVAHGVPWPFDGFAYADVLEVVDRFDTNDQRDLAGVYEALLGGETCDPFVDGGSAIRAVNDGNWADLLLHNLADIKRTRALALVAEQYVPGKDFDMKNLNPSDA